MVHFSVSVLSSLVDGCSMNDGQRSIDHFA